MVDQILNKIEWLGHAGFLIQLTGRNIYIDPYEISDDLPVADAILITHEHYDHCSPEDIAKIQGEQTIFVTEKSSVAKLNGQIKTLAPGDSTQIGEINVEAVPAYNTNKKFHPKSNNWLGFILTIDKVRIYHAGDTDYIPEMKGIKADIALLPVSGTYVMTPAEAVQCARDIKPAVVVPMHCGSLVGSMDDAKEFAKALEGEIRVKIKNVV